MSRTFVVVAVLAASAASAQEMKKAAPPAAAKPAPAATPAAPPAPPAAAMTMPKPAPELDQMKWMEGTWKCTGKVFATPMMGPEHATVSTVKVSRDLDKMWLTSRVEGKKTKVDPAPWKGQDFVSYDASTKKWNRIGIDSMGGWMKATSDGLQGDKLVWNGDMGGMGMTMGFRQTFTKKSAKEIQMMVEFSDAKKTKWTPLAEDSCKK